MQSTWDYSQKKGRMNYLPFLFLNNTTGFFLPKLKKTQGGKNSPNSITQDNFSQKTQQTGSIFRWLKKLNKAVLILRHWNLIFTIKTNTKLLNCAKRKKFFGFHWIFPYFPQYFTISARSVWKNSRFFFEKLKDFCKNSRILVKKLNELVVGRYTSLPKKVVNKKAWCNC